MKKLILWFILMFSLVACASAEENVNDAAQSALAFGETETVDSVNEAPDADIQEMEMEEIRLTESYADSLSISTQLAMGTILLEESELAVDETLASEILPLWEVVQSLNNSETAAAAETEAVLNQIQDTMSPAQVQAIADMNLTSDSMTEMFESGAIAFGGGMGRGQEAGSGMTLPEGFTPGQGGNGFAGGIGAPGGGGPGGFGGGQLSEEEMATRRAEITSEDGLAAIQDRAVVGAVIRLLQTKTGDAPENLRGTVVDAIYTAVAGELGLDVATVRAALAEGLTVTELIETYNGDVTAVRAAVTAGLNKLPNAAELDIEQIVDNWIE